MKQSSTLSVVALSILLSCQAVNTPGNQRLTSTHTARKIAVVADSLLYKSENLSIKRLSDHVYQHISYLNTGSFGWVACNGMIVVNDNEAVVFDTPTDTAGSRELIDYVTIKLHSKVKGVVATHFHADCVGGLAAFHEKSIPSYAAGRTINLLDKSPAARPQNSFDDSMALPVGNQKVYVQFMGEGHTQDNVIGYYPEDEILFGGCLVKEIGAGKGNLEDTNVAAWPGTVRKVKANYPDVKLVVPGHGKVGGVELLDYMIMLFE